LHVPSQRHVREKKRRKNTHVKNSEKNAVPAWEHPKYPQSTPGVPPKYPRVAVVLQRPHVKNVGENTVYPYPYPVRDERTPKYP
jgi:hypothetical protein